MDNIKSIPSNLDKLKNEITNTVEGVNPTINNGDKVTQQENVKAELHRIENETKRLEQEVQNNINSLHRAASFNLNNYKTSSTKIESDTSSLAQKLIHQTNDTIKKIAFSYIDKIKTTQKQNSNNFNLSKFAQHKTLEQFVINDIKNLKWSPLAYQNGIYETPWHVIERNKGYGLNIPEAPDLDWETIWRENIADKYFPDSRDENGNKIPGWMDKKVEEERNIPEGNNIQLPPGQKRNPYLPEFRGTESRLNVARGESVPDHTDKITNFEIDLKIPVKEKQNKTASFNLSSHKKKVT